MVDDSYSRVGQANMKQRLNKPDRIIIDKQGIPYLTVGPQRFYYFYSVVLPQLL